MNKDQVNGTIKGVVAKAQAQAGRAMGSPAQQAAGRLRASQARMQRAYGNLKEALKNSRHS